MYPCVLINVGSLSPHWKQRVKNQPREQPGFTPAPTMLVFAVLAILYHNVDLGRWWIAIDGVLGARTLNDVDETEGRCRSGIICVRWSQEYRSRHVSS